MSLILVACGGAESRKAKYLQSAEMHYKNDDCDKAKLDYRNVLQIDPKDADSRIGLARCLGQDQEWRSVYKLLSAVNDEYPDNIEAKHELAKLYLLSGDRDKTYELIEEVLAVDPKHASSIALRGLFHTANKTIVAARNDAQEALSIDKHNLLAVSLMSALHLKDEKYDDAIAIVRNAIANTQDDDRKLKELKVLLIAIYGRAGDIDSVIPIFEELIARYPDKAQYRNKLAVIYAEKGDYEKGEQVLLGGKSKDDASYTSFLSHVAYIDAYQGADKGLETLIAYAQQDDAHPRIKLALGERYFKNKEIDKAKPIFMELAENKLSTLEANEAKNYLAYLSLQEKDNETALNLVDEVLAESPTNQRALMIRGTMALSRRDAPQAIADFQTILRDEPNNTTVIRQLATAYILNGQTDLAKDVVQRAVEIDKDSKELNLLYARLQGQDKDYDSAIATVNELIQSNSDDIESIKTLFDLQIANNDLSGAKDTTDKLKLASEDNPLGYYLSGVLLQNEENYEEAEKQYLTALEKNPRANEPLSALIKLYLNQQEIDKALAYLDGLLAKDADYLVPYNLQGEIYLSQKNYSQAKAKFEQAIAKNDKWWVPYRGLSLMYAAQDDIENSLKMLQRGINNGADMERLGVDLALTQQRLERREDAINTYESILEKLPNSVLAKNNLSMLLVDDSADSEDIARAVSYIESFENVKEAALLDTAGWVYYRAGDLTKSIDYLSKAIALAPGNAEMNYHIGMAYAAQGNVVKAKEHLVKATNTDQEYMGKEIAQQKLNEL
jgi:tetratricopeptide (TPR) repeat protein